MKVHYEWEKPKSYLHKILSMLDYPTYDEYMERMGCSRPKKEPILEEKVVFVADGVEHTILKTTLYLKNE